MSPVLGTPLHALAIISGLGSSPFKRQDAGHDPEKTHEERANASPSHPAVGNQAFPATASTGANSRFPRIASAYFQA